MCFLPRRALNVSECEIARAYKVCGTSIEPIAFIVPRKVGYAARFIYKSGCTGLTHDTVRLIPVRYIPTCAFIRTGPYGW